MYSICDLLLCLCVCVHLIKSDFKIKLHSIDKHTWKKKKILITISFLINKITHTHTHSYFHDTEIGICRIQQHNKILIIYIDSIYHNEIKANVCEKKNYCQSNLRFCQMQNLYEGADDSMCQKIHCSFECQSDLALWHHPIHYDDFFFHLMEHENLIQTCRNV